MEKTKKNKVNKLGKIALMGMVGLGSVGGMLLTNSTQTSAIWSSFNTGGDGTIFEQGDDIFATLYNYGEDDWGPWDEFSYSYNDDKTTPIGKYTISFEPDQMIVDYGLSVYLKFGGKDIYRGTYTSTNRVTYTINVDSSNVNEFLEYGVVYGTGNCPPVNYGSETTRVYLRNFRWELYDTMAPAIETQVFFTDVDSPMTLDYILSQVKFVDEVDGDIEEVVVSDNYSSNKNKVGKWTIEVKATDNAGNTGYGTIEVWVQDKTAPIINGKTTYTSNMSSPLTREYIESQLSVSDNVDESVELTLVSDGFTGNENVVGTKTIVYRATDSAGNTSIDYTITINCVDDIKPTITGESNYTTSYKVALDVNTIKNALTLNDNISTGLTLEEVSNNYTGNESIPGTYFIKYRTTDNAGNISETFTITIVVNDKIPPVFYTSGLFIGISQANTLTHDDIVEVLLNMEQIVNENVGVALVDFGGYDVAGVNSPGVYTLSYRLVAEDGVESEVKTATINVLGEEEVKENDEKTQVEQRVKNLWQKIGDFFGNLWKWIVKYLGFGWLWDKDNKYNPTW